MNSLDKYTKEEIKSLVKLIMYFSLINALQLTLIYYVKVKYYLEGYAFLIVIDVILIFTFIIFLSIQLAYSILSSMSDDFSIENLIIFLYFLSLICVLAVVLMI